MTSNQVCQVLSVSPRILQYACEQKFIAVHLQRHTRHFSTEEALVLGIARQLIKRHIVVRRDKPGPFHFRAFRTARAIVRSRPKLFTKLVWFRGENPIDTNDAELALKYAVWTDKPVSIIDVGSLVRKIESVGGTQ